MPKGDDFSTKTLAKRLLLCQNDWSGRPALTFGKWPKPPVAQWWSIWTSNHLTGYKISLVHNLAILTRRYFSGFAILTGKYEKGD